MSNESAGNNARESAASVFAQIIPALVHHCLQELSKHTGRHPNKGKATRYLIPAAIPEPIIAVAVRVIGRSRSIPVHACRPA